MIDTLQIRREIEAARVSYARAHPEEARMLPMGSNSEYHIINALNFLLEAVEELDEHTHEIVEHTRDLEWVSNAGPVEISSGGKSPEPERVATWRAQDHEAGVTDPDVEAIDAARWDHAYTHDQDRNYDRYDGEGVESHWEDYPNPDTRIGE